MATEQLVVSISEKGALVVKRNVEGIGKGARNAEGSVKLLNRALGGIAAIGFATVLTSSIKLLAKFSQEMATVGAITNATGTQFDELREKAKDLGINTRFSATQAAEGMTFLARAGFNANQVLSAIGPTLNLAQAGALDLGRAADIASNILTGFRISADDAARVMDVLALAANSANTNVSQLGEAMKFIAPISAGLGVSLEETTAAVQSLSDAGIQASMAGTGLRMVMRLLESPMKKQRDIFKSLGIEAEELKISEVGLTGALQRLSDAGITTGQSLEAFGRAGTAFDVLVNAVPKIERFTAANEAAAGTSQRIADIMDDNLNGALLAVRSAWEGLIVSMGDTGAESGLTQGFQALAEVLRTVANNLKLTTDLTIAFGIAVAAVKFAPLLQGVSASVTQFLALRTAVASGSATMLGSVQADAAKAASSLAIVQAEARETAATLASAKALQAKLIVEKQGMVSSGFRIAQINKVAALEAKHAIQLNAVATAQARATVANKAASVSMLGLRSALVAVRGALSALAVNPLTIGLLALAAAVGVVTFAFDKYKKLQDEVARIEENTHQMRLKHVQARVREIQERNAATASLEAYTKRLQAENKTLGLNQQEQEEEINLLKAFELAKRPLTELEEKTIINLLRERNEIKAKNETRKEELRLLASIKGPQEEYAQQLVLLNSLLAKGEVTQKEYATTLKDLQTEYKQLGSEGMTEYLAKLNEETELLKKNGAEQEVQRALLAARAQLGTELSEAQAASIRAVVEERQALTQDDYLDALKQENELLKLNTQEQEVQRELLNARAQFGGELTEDQENTVRLLVAEKQALVEANEELAKHNEGTANLGEALGNLETASLTVQDSLETVWMNASGAIDEFIDGGIITFKGFTMSIIKDITKIAAKLALLQAFKGITGGFGIGGFATGGSFTVKGSGGTDSQPVGFMATPGERVDVLTPAQQQAQQQGQQAQQGGGGVMLTIINVADESEIPAIMAGAAGQEVTLNTISFNKTTVKAALS